MGPLIQKVADAIELRHFLATYPNMRVVPAVGDKLFLSGIFDFSAESKNGPALSDTFEITLSVPLSFPLEIPTVIEVGGRIPRDGEYHTNPAPEHSLCLGSRIRLLHIISKEPTLSGYANNCLVPYLYAISNKLKFNSDFLLGELDHGTLGELDDYVNLFRVNSHLQAVLALKYLGMKKRKANKYGCPCGCNRRLGSCPFNYWLKEFRLITKRTEYRKIYSSLDIKHLSTKRFNSFRIKYPRL